MEKKTSKPSTLSFGHGGHAHGHGLDAEEEFVVCREETREGETDEKLSH